LVRLLPQTATRLEKDAKGNDTQTIIAASELALGDRVLIKPGETIPADGSVIEGTSSANESVLTGESMPRQKTVGDALIGGSVNVESPLTMQVDKLGDSTMLSSIIRLLDRAQSEKPNLAKFADRSAGWFVLLLLGIAVAVFATWWFIDPSRAFWVALSVLVITCPCALSLATPAALTAATGNLTEQGVLATRGHALETLAKITHIIFDKTGTLTYGRLKVVKTQVLSDDLSENECSALASGLEASSEHPIAQAIQQLSSKPKSFVQLSAESGRGVEGKLDNKAYRIGTQSYVAELAGDENLNLNNDKNEAALLETTIYLGKKNQWLAVFDLQDEIRKEAKQSIEKLQAMGIKVSLLSGDNPQAVKVVSQALGIESASAELLPADKLAKVQQYQSQGEVVAMIGDGVNDAPVLAAADVSIAMGSGSQLAQASADMILLSENLAQLPSSIQLSKRMQSIIHQNFAWAIVYNLVAIPLAAMGWVLPWMAAIGMSMSSLVVVLNALRLKK